MRIQCSDRAQTASPHPSIQEFRAFVTNPSFPCVGAKSALSTGRMEFLICQRLGSRGSAEVLANRLAQFSRQHPGPSVDPVSFVAIFRESVSGEEEFHRHLWMQLQAIHNLDVAEHPWAPGVSADPSAANFSFSVASRAFFVVGLHPHSSRMSRRASQPTLVFNFHDQFQAMRATGRYAKLQAAIRNRDFDLQGSINPNLAGFGEASEALQYSGRVGGGCPFRTRRPGQS